MDKGINPSKKKKKEWTKEDMAKDWMDSLIECRKDAWVERQNWSQRAITVGEFKSNRNGESFEWI